MKYKHIDFNKTIKCNIASPTTGVHLGKSCDNTVASSLRSKIRRG